MSIGLFSGQQIIGLLEGNAQTHTALRTSKNEANGGGVPSNACHLLYRVTSDLGFEIYVWQNGDPYIEFFKNKS